MATHIETNDLVQGTTFESVVPYKGVQLFGTDLANFYVDQWKKNGWDVFWEHYDGEVIVDGRKGFGHCMVITVWRSLTPSGGFIPVDLKIITGLDYEACKRCSARLAIPEHGVKTTFVKKLTKRAIFDILTPWSSSKANEYTKDQAVNVTCDVLTGASQFLDLHLTTGAYSERSHCSGRSWAVYGDAFCIERVVHDTDGAKPIERWVFVGEEYQTCANMKRFAKRD
jgi:hypothetical protein